MPDAFCLYIDDSGTRHPDRKPGQQAPERDWFGLGGIMFRETDQEPIRARHSQILKKWNISTPFHSSDIRAQTGWFRWLRERTPEERADFLADITSLTTLPQIIATACVVDRPGYNHRYLEKHGPARWSLCRTAFAIVIERAVKFARANQCKLRVYVERSDQKTDRIIRNYYEELRKSGNPFNPGSSSRYTPLTADDFRDSLHEFKIKDKTSPPMQIADLCLWPVCTGGYQPDHPAYLALGDAGTLIDSRVPSEEVAERGIKYSCWDLVTMPEKTDAQF